MGTPGNLGEIERGQRAHTTYLGLYVTSHLCDNSCGSLPADSTGSLRSLHTLTDDHPVTRTRRRRPLSNAHRGELGEAGMSLSSILADHHVSQACCASPRRCRNMKLNANMATWCLARVDEPKQERSTGGREWWLPLVRGWAHTRLLLVAKLGKVPLLHVG